MGDRRIVTNRRSRHPFRTSETVPNSPVPAAAPNTIPTPAAAPHPIASSAQNFSNHNLTHTDAKLYLTAKIVSESSFEKYHGLDLADPDDTNGTFSGLLVRVLKTEIFMDFKQKIATHFSVLPEGIRLWLFARRQNKTIRPNKCIPKTAATWCNTIHFPTAAYRSHS